MATMILRDLPDEVYRALRVRADLHGHSVETEAREILQAAVMSETRLRLGSLLAEIGRQIGLTDDEAALFDQIRRS